MNRKIGEISKQVIELLNLEVENDTDIWIGDSNINHMKREHREDYEKYGANIEDIINNPTYVVKNPNQDSIEFIKEYVIYGNLVLVAVRR